MLSSICERLKKGSTLANICSTCKSINFIKVRNSRRQVRVCEECFHTCMKELRPLFRNCICVPCIINKIKAFIIYCMIHENNVTPDKIEEIVEGWVNYKELVPNSNNNRGYWVWVEYWSNLVMDGIIRDNYDLNGWFKQLGHDLKICNDIESEWWYAIYDEWIEDDIDRAFNVICQSSRIKEIMREGVEEGKQILTKRKNLQIKHKSFVRYILYTNDNERRYPTLHDVIYYLITCYI